MTFFRYKNTNTTSGVRVDEYKYKLAKETTKGYWICAEWNDHVKFEQLHKEKLVWWISKDGRKKFAYESRERAWVNFQLRKLAEIRILTRRLEIAKTAYGCQQPKAEGFSQVAYGILNARNDCLYGN